MKRSDIGLSVIIYAVIASFFIMTIQLKRDAQIYPITVMSILFILNTAYLVQCFWKKKKSGMAIINDSLQLFEGFQAKQFFYILLTSIIYLFLIETVGFYIATMAYIIAVLVFLKVTYKYILITVVAFGCLVYGAFTLFLHVPLPTGIFI